MGNVRFTIKAKMILDVVAGIFAALDALFYWRFLTCFAPAFALVLMLYLSRQEGIGDILVSILFVVGAALLGTGWELGARHKMREKVLRRLAS
jgi:hypothetical protein